MAQVDIFRSPELASLSNFATGFGFWISEGAPPIRKWWPSAEHYLQAGQFVEVELQERVRCADEPGQAKALGRSLEPLRADWDMVKRSRVRTAMLEKLWAHPEARETLLGIPESKLIINGNSVDPYFGTGGDGTGENVIGTELESMRALFRHFPCRRQLEVKVADIGEPFQPTSIFVDLTGARPDAVASIVASALVVPFTEIDSVDFLTEGGFEKTSAARLETVKGLEEFFSNNEGDCLVEVSLRNLARVTLWDGTNDVHLGTTDIRHLCPCANTIVERVGALQPLMTYPAFRGCLRVIIDSDQDRVTDLDSSSFALALAAASEMADVVISAFIEIPTGPQHSLLKQPGDVGPPKVVCGRYTDLDALALADRVQGVIWGAALGDAVGLATEFMKKEEAVANYKEPHFLSPGSRVQDKHRSRWAPGDWTDDTDQLVLLLDAIIAGGGILDQHRFASSLKHWKENGFPELGDTRGLGIGETVYGVLEHPAYDVAPDIAAQAVWRQHGCVMAANGAIMRCAGGALTYFKEVLAYNARAGAAVTHADPRCAASCVAVATLIARVLTGVTLTTTERRGEEVSGAAFAAIRHLDGGDRDELWRYMSTGPDDLSTLDLGSGGIG
eukprot:CAMPEP_0180558020 /NCGR_PEP_ID=MMETSP1037_2-20121125/1489_1 /TAXON_ID=632150 /ORGANISM="Azadinium spinosum, Strain 3D9" /LENGTH=616 /DNA_ID=CAMNT_0022574295 /DNA_START=20 /DNA_END=1866 /DNA_ORIENTATION=+